MDAVLELEIGPGPEPGSYTVDVLRSVGGGQPRATMSLDLESLVDRRDDLEASVLASAVTARRVLTESEAAIRQVGRTLFESAFTGEVRAAYRTSVAVAAERGSGVQLALRLTAPGLAALPWEALFDPVEGVYLCRKEPLVRHVPTGYTPPSLEVAPPLRVLAMVSSPRGLPPLDADHERELLDGALREHLRDGRVEVDWLTEVTWSNVHDRLLDGEWHVLHFIGHGTYDTVSDEGVLAFVDEHGRADYVPASSLADLLDEADPTPRLVLLNSCRSGAGGTADLFSGTAAALAHSGIHAVAAMQFSISDSAALQFSRGFYSALAHGRGIDEAVRSGRIGILGTGPGTLEWVTPVLYLRGEDTRLFDFREVERMPRPAPPAPDPVSAPPPATAPIPAPAPTPPPTQARAAPPSARGPAPESASPAPTPTTAPTPQPWWPTSDEVATGRGRSASPRRGGTPRWLPWVVVALVAVAAIVVAAVLVVPRLIGSGTATEDVGAGGGQGTQAGDGVVTGDTMSDGTPADAVVALTNTDQWVSTELTCSAGDLFALEAEGEMSWNGTDEGVTGPGGADVDQPGLVAGLPHAAVIAGLLHHADERVPVGTSTTYACPNAGTLWVGVNDAAPGDNRGEFIVRVRQLPAE
ncbi:CHAT domain-containing protein [Agromyces marinus]|uniref:CHAT domain-containing protein n=1 Tax=Agromyces marinus TaxID=1389020 RepID=A0ABM8H158_9MICO|nr:CHAT domain-containing protein [Agromyces marinus]UIP57373.1 hypothetical protein DSM26151_02280 [Agromyces marinus]BDZ54518.1 hypothetical protein GCM10025870_15910 [Agromyces marinus]